MSQSSPHLVSARAIEDIIQISKIIDKLPKVIESEILKEKIEDADYSHNKHNQVSAFMDNSICLPKVIEGNAIKQSDVKIRKRVEGSGSEGDHQLADVYSDDVKLSEKRESDLELESWPSDSDITVIRMKKEYRSELSQKVTWEEERNLTENSSSKNFDWESHSLINLANITAKEKDELEGLTPYTIWSKTENESKEANRNSDIEESFRNENMNDLIFCPPDKMVFYVPQEDEFQEQQFYNLSKENLPVLDEKINVLFQTESSSVINEPLRQKKIDEVSDILLSGNKLSKPGKLKLFKNIFNCFAKCGSKKVNLEKD